MRFISDSAAQLAKVGLTAKIESVEPLDFGNFARPNCYSGSGSAELNTLWGRIEATIKPEEVPQDGG